MKLAAPSLYPQPQHRSQPVQSTGPTATVSVRKGMLIDAFACSGCGTRLSAKTAVTVFVFHGTRTVACNEDCHTDAQKKLNELGRVRHGFRPPEPKVKYKT